MIQILNDIHFTSNLHFRNKDVAIVRGFNNVEEMEINLIDQWNSQIKPNDTVFVLGGFCSIVKGALQSYMVVDLKVMSKRKELTFHLTKKQHFTQRMIF